MNEEKMTWLLPLFAVMLAMGVLIAGCEIDSAESATRSVNINVEGWYSNPDGGAMVSKNTGQPVSNLNVRQAGDRLEAIDNSGMIYKGTIGQVIGDSDPRSASFTLSGNNTVGNKATWSGTFEVSGSSSTMRGTWIEDAYYAEFYATATVNPLPSQTPTPTNSPTATPTPTPTPETNTTSSAGSGSVGVSIGAVILPTYNFSFD